MIKQTLTAALVALSLGTAFAATTSSAFAWDDCEHDRPSYSHNDDSYGNHGYRRQGYNEGNQYSNRRRGYDGGYNNGY